MKFQHIPVCYFPTRIVFIDDNENFLKSILFDLDIKDVNCKMYTHSKKALEFIKNSIAKYNHSFDNLTLKNNENIKVYEKIYDPDRFNTLSIIITDYNMPELNGEDICKQIGGHHIKKILLTGEVDEKIAVRLFNEGLIDKFIRKDSLSFNRVLSDAIKEFQKLYFHNISSNIITDIKHQMNINFFIEDSVFIDFVWDIFQKHNYCEYYLLDTSGSVMLINDKGEISLLLVKSEDELKGYYELALIEKQSKQVIEKLYKKTHMPVFNIGKENIITPSDNWEKSLYKIDYIKGKQYYYYSLIENANKYFTTNDIVPFKKNFLN